LQFSLQAVSPEFGYTFYVKTVQAKEANSYIFALIRLNTNLI